MVRVERDARELDGIAHGRPGDVDAQAAHEPARVEVDVLALARERGHLHVGNAAGVLGGVEIGVVGLVGEVDVDRELLGGLLVVEVETDVAHLGVKVGELERVVHRRELVLAVGRLLQGELVVQADGVVARRQEEVHVEEERLQQKRDDEERERAFDEMLHRRTMPAHEAPVDVG